MGPRGLLVAALVIALSSVRADEACSGHGSVADGKCVCSTPLPVDGLPGWVGNKCAIQVHSVTLDGKDIQETCGQGHSCNVVTPNEPICFSTDISDLGSSAFHLNVLLSSNSVEATIVLRGLLTNFTSTADPASGTAKVVPQAYPESGLPYSLAVRTSQTSLSTQMKLTRRQLGYGAHTGLYLCATSNATTTFSLRAAKNACPFDLYANGTMRLCSGRGSDDVCPHGMCTCPPPYIPPANWVMTPGLGFEDCSTSLLQLQPSNPLLDLAHGGWAFYSLELPDTFGAELHVWAAATELTQGSLVLYLRYQQLPGVAADQHDLASDSAASPYPSSWRQDQSAHLILRRQRLPFQPGTWYLGAHNRGVGPVSLTVGSAVYDCPNNCSGRGTCDSATVKCNCTEPTAPGFSDCSISLRELELGQQVDVPPRVFTYEELVLRGVGEKLQTSPAARMNLTVSFTTTDSEPHGLPAWMNGRPVVFVAPSLEAALNKSRAGADGVGPHSLHPDGPMESLVLSTRGTPYSMDIGPWTVGEDGALHIVIWNPLSSPVRQVGYTLVVALDTKCPGGCSEHGTCNETTGECECDPPFTGADCSVGICKPGSYREAGREGLRGVCWTPCRSDGGSFDDQSCDILQCDGPGEGHGQLRRKGSEVECVEDQCMAGNYTMTDPSGDFICTRPCTCPADGGACTMKDGCLPGTKQCLKGLQLAADGERCVECKEGNLRRGYEFSGGIAYSVCLCTSASDPSSCHFTTPTQEAGNTGAVVTCQSGFQRQGATNPTKLFDGSTVVMGGQCAQPPRPGVSGGMVFFYCLLSIFLAAGLVVGGKYGVLWYEQYRYGKSVFSQGYMSWPLFGNRGNAGSATDDW